jgi:hypothetical protein
VKEPEMTDKTLLIAQHYLAKCARAYTQYTSEYVLTMDETFWPLLPHQQQLVRIKGIIIIIIDIYHIYMFLVLYCNLSFLFFSLLIGSPIRPSSTIDTKTGITLVVTVTAHGNKLPLYYVTAGKTMKCTEKLQLVSYTPPTTKKEKVFVSYTFSFFFCFSYS